MIYFITPNIHDFRHFCLSNGFGYSNGRSLTKDVKWIDCVKRLRGLVINPDVDKVIKGDDFYNFNHEEIDQIEIELAVRTRK